MVNCGEPTRLCNMRICRKINFGRKAEHNWKNKIMKTAAMSLDPFQDRGFVPFSFAMSYFRVTHNKRNHHLAVLGNSDLLERFGFVVN